MHEWELKPFETEGVPGPPPKIWTCQRCGAMSWRKEEPSPGELIPYNGDPLELQKNPPAPTIYVTCDEGIALTIMES